MVDNWRLLGGCYLSLSTKQSNVATDQGDRLGWWGYGPPKVGRDLGDPPPTPIP